MALDGGNTGRVVRNLAERNVGTRRKNLKLDLTSAEVATLPTINQTKLTNLAYS